MSTTKRVLKNTGFLYARMGITMFVSLYSTRLILAALGVEDFGIYNVIAGAIAMLAFLNAAMASSTQRFMSYSQGEGDQEKQLSIFNISVVIHFIVGILVVIFLETAGHFLFNGVLKIPAERIVVAKILFQFMIASTFFTIISVPYDAVLNAHENMLFLAIIGVLESLLKLAVAVYITYSHNDKLIAYGLLITIIAIISIIIKRIYCHHKYAEVVLKVKRYFEFPLFRQMIGFAGWSFLFSAVSMVSMYGITILANSFFGVVVNAAQGVANQISGQLMAFSNTMLQALNPVIVKSEGENNRQRMIKAAQTGSKLSFLLLAFIALPVIIEMPFILDIWLKDVPAYSIIFCRLLLMAHLMSQLSVTFFTAIGAMGNIRNSRIWDSCIYVLYLPLSYVLFKLGGSPIFIYINSLLIHIALIFSRLYFMHHLGGMSVKKFVFDVVCRCFVVFLGTFSLSVILIFILPSGYLRLLSVLILSSSIFIALGYLIGLNEEEKSKFKELTVSLIKTFFKRLKVQQVININSE